MKINVFFYFSPEDHVDNFIHLIDTNDNRLYRSEIHLRTRQYLIQVSESEGDPRLWHGSSSARRWGGYEFNSRPKPRHS